MEASMKTMLFLHVIAGFTSLVLFWIPIFTRKGGKLHRKVGKAYVLSMWVVVISAGLLCIYNSSVGRVNSAIFLGYLSILSGNPLWHGMAVLKNKKRLSTNFLRTHLMFNWVLFIGAMALITYGSILAANGSIHVLMFIFGALGLTTGFDIHSAYKGGTQLSWFQAHYKGLITSGIAAYTAFFAFGGRQLLANLLTGYWMVIPWVLPTVLGVTAMRLFDRYYQKRVEATSVQVGAPVPRNGK